MIERQRSEVEIVCDDCGDRYGPYPSNEFRSMMNAANAEGWRAYQVDGIWKNACPDCTAEFAASRKRAAGCFGVRCEPRVPARERTEDKSLT